MSNYVCSWCGRSAYYDGRCGDGPILTCGCDKIGRNNYGERNSPRNSLCPDRGGERVVYSPDAKPIEVD